MGGRKYNRRHHSSTKLKRNTKTREQHVFNSLHGKNIDWGVWTALFFFSHRPPALFVLQSWSQPRFWPAG
jgi:hypothetical protein